nr:MAG TPA: EarP [Caudoviricetes sp.]
MIQANELRIGNYIVFEDCVYAWDISDETIQNALDNGVYARGISKIEEIRSYDVMSNGKLYPFNNVYPVPLTEKILLKCNFKKEILFPLTFTLTVQTYILSPRINIYAYLDNDKVCSSIRLIQGSNKNGNMIQIMSLHQLQNLYFTLTGKELEINL